MCYTFDGFGTAGEVDNFMILDIRDLPATFKVKGNPGGGGGGGIEEKIFFREKIRRGKRRMLTAIILLARIDSRVLTIYTGIYRLRIEFPRPEPGLLGTIRWRTVGAEARRKRPRAAGGERACRATKERPPTSQRQLA